MLFKMCKISGQANEDAPPTAFPPVHLEKGQKAQDVKGSKCRLRWLAHKLMMPNEKTTKNCFEMDTNWEKKERRGRNHQVED